MLKLKMSFLFDGNQGGTGWTCLVSLTQSQDTEKKERKTGGKTASTQYAKFLQTLYKTKCTRTPRLLSHTSDFEH